jgi:hypothetical protein
MRALLVALLLALATAVPAFADDDGGGGYRPPVTTDVTGAGTATP